jgi:uncharacterized membrane protein YecN with MAPEG domain
MTDTERTDLIWETDLPLLSRRMLTQWTAAMAVTALVMTLILGLVFAAQGEWDALPPMLAMIGAVTAGLWLLGLLIMALLFRGKYRVRYTLGKQGIRCDTVDRVAKAANRLAIVAGVLARSPQTLGAGLIATSRESEEARWGGAFKAVMHPDKFGIDLRNAWRPLLWVQCTPENYAQVAERIAEHMRRCGTQRRARGKSPLPAYLGRTALVLAASFPLFPLAEEFDTGLFLPIFILCFALATVWLINLFGWVVIGGLLVQAAGVILDQMEMRESFFDKGRYYRAWEVLGSDDIGLLLIAGLGAAILVWISWSALKGRWLAALMQGYQDMGA